MLIGKHGKREVKGKCAGISMLKNGKTSVLLLDTITCTIKYEISDETPRFCERSE